MATTPKGIYFPEGKTTANFIEIFSNIAESVDAALDSFTYDSGWIDQLEFGNGWERYNSTSFRVSYRRLGKVVYHTGLIRYGTENTQLYRIPVGFRPTRGTEVFYCLTSASVDTANSGLKGTRINVSTDGRVRQSGSVALGTGFISLNSIKYISDESL